MNNQTGQQIWLRLAIYLPVLVRLMIGYWAAFWLMRRCHLITVSAARLT